MTFETWLLFTITETVLCLTPGPAVLLVVSIGISRGLFPSVSANLGILVANALYFLLSALGLAAVLLASYEVFFLIKWIGAGYLLYLGICAFRSKTPALAGGGTEDGHARPAIRTFTHGFVLQAANPKSLLFFGALLPQFVDPGQPMGTQIAILGVTSVVIEFSVLVFYGALAGRARRFATRPRFVVWINRVAGSLLIAAAAGMATIRRGA